MLFGIVVAFYKIKDILEESRNLTPCKGFLFDWSQFLFFNFFSFPLFDSGSSIAPNAAPPGQWVPQVPFRVLAKNCCQLILIDFDVILFYSCR